MKKKILFVAQKMTVGGIGTSLVNLLRVMDASSEAYEITLFTFSGGALLHQLPESVRVKVGSKGLRLAATSFGEVRKSKKLFDILQRLAMMVYVRVFGADRLYRKLLRINRSKEHFDVAISYFNDITTNYFSRGTNLYVSDFTDADQKIAWIHTDPELCRFDADYCKDIYKKFDTIFCVSNAIKRKMDALVPDYRDKTEVFYNLFPEEEIIKKAGEKSPYSDEVFHIVTVGRVDNDTKRMDGIIRLCRRLREDGVTGFLWHIVGGGPDLEKNLCLAEELGVREFLDFCGEQKNPYPYIRFADLFALYSAYEGFPMVIGETLILGTEILTTDYAAAEEQLAGKNGQIAKNDEEFYQLLKEKIAKKAW